MSCYRNICIYYFGRVKFHWISPQQRHRKTFMQCAGVMKTFTHTGVYTGQNPKSVQMISAQIAQT